MPGVVVIVIIEDSLLAAFGTFSTEWVLLNVNLFIVKNLIDFPVQSHLVFKPIR